jgi:hypothetical protein
MKTISASKQGLLLTGRASHMIFFLFLLNLLLSMILAVPMYHILKDSFGQGETAEKMAEGFDYLWWEQFRYRSQGIAKTFSPSIIGKGALLDNCDYLLNMNVFKLPSVILTLIFIYILFRTFLAGGILRIYNSSHEKFRIKNFFSGAGTYYLRFILLMLISWVFFYLIGIILNRKFTSILNRVSSRSYSEIPSFYLDLLFSAIVLILFLFIQMVFDYARIDVVRKERRNVIKSIWKSVFFVFRHPVSTLGLFYLLFLAGVAWAIAYSLVAEVLPDFNFLGVVTGFMAQEIFILGVIWIRCWLYAGEMALYRSA